jgi:hypothetical protein
MHEVMVIFKEILFCPFRFLVICSTGVLPKLNASGRKNKEKRIARILCFGFIKL